MVEHLFPTNIGTYGCCVCAVGAWWSGVLLFPAAGSAGTAPRLPRQLLVTPLLWTCTWSVLQVLFVWSTLPQTGRKPHRHHYLWDRTINCSWWSVQLVLDPEELLRKLYQHTGQEDQDRRSIREKNICTSGAFLWVSWFDVWNVSIRPEVYILDQLACVPKSYWSSWVMPLLRAR